MCVCVYIEREWERIENIVIMKEKGIELIKCNKKRRENKILKKLILI